MELTPSQESIRQLASRQITKPTMEQSAHPDTTAAIADLRAQLKTLNSELHHTKRKLEGYEDEERRRDTAEAKREEAEERREKRAAERSRRADSQVREARIAAIRAIARLLPQAVAQARRGKPALLRMILRATR